MNYDNIIDRTKEIETILTDIGAIGKGLHEKVSSIQKTLNKSVVKAIRYIATIRNNALHESNFKLTKEIIDEFEDAYEMVFLMLNIELKKEKSINQEKKLDKECVRGKEYCPNCEEYVRPFRIRKDIGQRHYGSVYLVKECPTCEYEYFKKWLSDYDRPEEKMTIMEKLNQAQEEADKKLEEAKKSLKEKQIEFDKALNIRY